MPWFAIIIIIKVQVPNMDMVKRVFIEPTQPYKSWTMRATKFNKWNIFWVKNAFAADAHQARIVSNKPFSFSWKQSFKLCGSSNIETIIIKLAHNKWTPTRIGVFSLDNLVLKPPTFNLENFHYIHRTRFIARFTAMLVVIRHTTHNSSYIH